MSEELAGTGEVKADEWIGFAEVRVRGRDEDERANGFAVVCGEAHGDGSAMGVAEDDGAVKMELREDAANLLGGGGEARVDVVAALGLTGSGKIEGNNVEVGAELLHERNEGVGATHEAVQEDEGGLSLHRLSSFEVREAKAIELKMTALHHSEEIPLFGCGQLTSRRFGWSIDHLIDNGRPKVGIPVDPVLKIREIPYRSA